MRSGVAACFDRSKTRSISRHWRRHRLYNLCIRYKRSRDSMRLEYFFDGSSTTRTSERGPGIQSNNIAKRHSLDFRSMESRYAPILILWFFMLTPIKSTENLLRIMQCMSNHAISRTFYARVLVCQNQTTRQLLRCLAKLLHRLGNIISTPKKSSVTSFWSTLKSRRYSLHVHLVLRGPNPATWCIPISLPSPQQES